MLSLPKEVFLEHLGHHEAVLHLAGPGVLVIGGEAGQLLQRVLGVRSQELKESLCLTIRPSFTKSLGPLLSSLSQGVFMLSLSENS